MFLNLRDMADQVLNRHIKSLEVLCGEENLRIVLVILKECNSIGRTGVSNSFSLN